MATPVTRATSTAGRSRSDALSARRRVLTRALMSSPTPAPAGFFLLRDNGPATRPAGRMSGGGRAAPPPSARSQRNLSPGARDTRLRERLPKSGIHSRSNIFWLTPPSIRAHASDGWSATNECCLCASDRWSSLSEICSSTSDFRSSTNGIRSRPSVFWSWTTEIPSRVIDADR